MLIGSLHARSPFFRGPLGLVISEDCAYAPELMQGRLDELDQIVNQTITVLRRVVIFSTDVQARGRADALERALRELWQPFSAERYPGQFQEPVEKWIHQDAMDHVCAAISMTQALAEETYMGNATGEIAEEYGTLIHLMAQLRDKYVDGKLPEEKLRPIGPVILMIAGITGLSVLAAHIVAENNKLEARRARRK